MLEVVQVGNRWTWRWLCAAGRTLVYTADDWETDMEAFNAARSYRVEFWGRADWIDHRMGACV